jgi:hypothetical protein
VAMGVKDGVLLLFSSVLRGHISTVLFSPEACSRILLLYLDISGVSLEIRVCLTRRMIRREGASGG